MCIYKILYHTIQDFANIFIIILLIYYKIAAKAVHKLFKDADGVLVRTMVAEHYHGLRILLGSRIDAASYDKFYIGGFLVYRQYDKDPGRIFRRILRIYYDESAYCKKYCTGKKYHYKLNFDHKKRSLHNIL